MKLGSAIGKTGSPGNGKGTWSCRVSETETEQVTSGPVTRAGGL